MKNRKEGKNNRILRNAAVASIVLCFVLTTLTSASLQLSQITNKEPLPKSIAWDAQLNFTAPIGTGDNIVFGEAPDALDGKDGYDTPKSPMPPEPYINSFFNTTFAIPYNTLYKEYKNYPAVSKTWNFKVIWANSSSGIGTRITCRWNPIKVNLSEYTSVVLMRKGPLNSTWYAIADLLHQNSFSYLQESYEFPPGSGTIYWVLTDVFKIICLGPQLTLTTSGTGSGTIQASSGPYYKGTTVTIWANASVSSTFTGFTGSLTGTTTPQTLVMNGNKAVDAQFTLKGPYPLTLTQSGTGSGTIQANRTTSLYYGYKVKVWANVSVGSTFNGFTGSLTGTTTPQTLIVDGNEAVDAQFTLNGPYTLTLTLNGTGSGTIQASPAGPYYYGASVTIWANASVGSTFTGFTGSLTGTTTPQTLVMNGNKAVNAQFTLQSGFTLTLTMSGTGSGTIQASPSGPYTYGTVVTIWANASTTSIFTGFSGALSGTTTPQTLIMNGNKAVDAAFTQNITFKKGFFMGSISNVNESGDLVTFECKRVRCIWFSPFSVTLQKTGHMIVSMESHGLLAFIGKSVIFGRFSAALTDTVDVVQSLPTITIDEKVPTENAPNSILSPYTS